jgi:hypothetical protein
MSGNTIKHAFHVTAYLLLAWVYLVLIDEYHKSKGKHKIPYWVACSAYLVLAGIGFTEIYSHEKPSNLINYK